MLYYMEGVYCAINYQIGDLPFGRLPMLRNPVRRTNTFQQIVYYIHQMKCLILLSSFFLFGNSARSQEKSHLLLVEHFQKFYNAGLPDSISTLITEKVNPSFIWNEKTFKDFFQPDFGEVLTEFKYEGKDEEGLEIYKLVFNRSIQKMTFLVDQKDKFTTLRFVVYN
jgi:hypothetical protein